jgi:hypothetical protein
MKELDTSAQAAHSLKQQLLLPEATRDEQAPQQMLLMPVFLQKP